MIIIFDDSYIFSEGKNDSVYIEGISLDRTLYDSYCVHEIII